MTVISSTKNLEALSLAIVAEFDAGTQRVWQIWEDPRQLELWWGPPTWPATFHEFDFRPGGRAGYYMTGPDGSKAHGWWQFTAIAAPLRLELDDGFADDQGNPTTEMGTARMAATLEDLSGRTRMTITTVFESTEQMEKMIQMGMEEGMGQAMGQIDALLAERDTVSG